MYFKYPEEVRKAIYTTNAVEAVHRQFRKLTKTKGGFANENSLLKLFTPVFSTRQKNGLILCTIGIWRYRRWRFILKDD